MIALFRSKKKIILSEEERRKRWSVSLLCGVAILLPALCYAVLGDAPVVVLLLAVPLAGAILKRKALPVTLRSVIYSVVVPGSIVVFLNQIYKVDPNRFFMPIPAELAVPMFLGIAVGFCFLVQNTRTLTVIMLLIVLAMLEQGTMLNDPTDNHRLSVAGTIWVNRHFTYGVTVLGLMATLLPMLYFALPRRRSVVVSNARQARRKLFYAASVVSLLITTALFCWFMPGVFERMDTVMTPMLEAYFNHVQTPPVFGDNVDLNDTLGLKNDINSRKIIFRVASPVPPLYMRGRVYLDYDQGRWKARKEESSQLATLDVDEALSVKRFVRSPAAPSSAVLPKEEMSVYVTDRYRTDVLFAPGNAEVVEAIAGRLSMEPNGTLTPFEWDSQGGYSVYLPKIDQYAAWQQPSAAVADNKDYLAVPAELVEPLAAQAERIFGPAGQTDAEQIRQLEGWFDREYTYELGVKLSRAKDPALSFLEDVTSGHCELFATASALLLRSRGIPARYVTGFFCAEKHPRKGYWLARMGDGHAWVEAYDRQQQQWVIVESTPVTGIPNGEDRLNWLERLRETLAAHWEAVFVQMKRGYIAEATIGVLLGVWGLVVWAFWTGPWYVMWPVALAVIWWLTGERVRGFLKHRKNPDSTRSLVAEELRLWRERLEAHLRRYGVQRGHQGSVRDLIRLAQACDHQEAGGIVPLLEEYEMLRYRPDHPPLAAVKDFGNRAEAWLRGQAPSTGRRG